MKPARLIQGLIAQITRLSKREKRILYASLAAVLLFGLDRLIIVPIHQRMVALSREITDKEASVRKNLRILSLKDRIIDETLKLAPLLNKIDFDEREVSGLLKEIENYANEAEVNLINIKPQGMQDRDSWRIYQVALNCEAEMEQLVTFMYLIENANSMLLIERYQIVPKRRDSSTASVNMRINKIVAK